MARKPHKPLLISLVGARPQFVKLAPLAHSFARLGLEARVKHDIYHSGQHYDHQLSDVFFDELKIPDPDHNLQVGSGAHGEMTAEMLRLFERELIKRRPKLVAVYGDTNTTLAGALAAAKLDIPVSHIEAGLRSFVTSMPEEINRRMTDHLSELLFAPTTEAVRNLRKEHVPGLVVRSGDLMYELLERVDPLLQETAPLFARFKITSGNYALFTAHRPATVDTRDTLERMIALLRELPLPVIFPVHPRTAASLKRHRLKGAVAALKHVRPVEPLSYRENLTLARHAALVVTDSGGLQKEAVFQGVKCLTMREETEWTETLRQGNHLIGLSVSRLRDALSAPDPKRRLSWKVDGRTPSEIILERTLKFLGA